MISTAPLAKTPSTRIKSTPVHLPFLDGLRAFAALYVLVHHEFLQVGLEQPTLDAAGFIGFVFRFGRYAVDLFIVLSGFCLMLPFVSGQAKKLNPRTFFIKRARRILPTYYCALIVSMLLIATLIGTPSGTNWDVSIPVTAWDVVSHLLLIQDLFVDTCQKINHTFWSISVEWKIYFLFPMLVYCFKVFGNRITLAGVLFFSIAGWYGLGKIGLNFYTAAPHYTALFAFGMLAAIISKAKNQNTFSKHKYASMKIAGYISFSAVIAISISSTFFNHTISALYSDLLVGVAAACLLLMLSKSNPEHWALKLLSSKPLVFVGSFAYSIYLVHAPVLQVLYQYILMPLHIGQLSSFALLFFLATPVILFLCYLFFLIAELPFIRRKKPAYPILSAV